MFQYVIRVGLGFVGIAMLFFLAGFFNWHTESTKGRPTQSLAIAMWSPEGPLMVFGWVLTACLLIELIMGLNEGSVVSDGHGFFFLQPLWKIALFAGVAILVGAVSTAAFYFGDRAGFRVANRYSVRPYR